MKKILIGLITILTCTFIFKYYNVFAEKLANILNIKSTSNIDEDINININLDNITFDRFKLVLTSSDNIKDINVSNDINIDTIDNNEISFEFDKTTSNLNSINLNYSVNKEHNVNDIITFNVTIINLDNEEEIVEESYNVTLTGNTSNSNSNQTGNKPVIDEPNTSIKEDNKNEPKTGNTPVNSTTNKTSNITNITVSKTSSIKISNVVSSVKTSTTGSYVEPVKYNGSDNNYLSNITINGYELNKEFKKEGNTYFVTIPSTVNKLTIKTTKEVSSSKVSINGNDNLKEGLNKILINVTAENGNTRVYRIYVTKESE